MPPRPPFPKREKPGSGDGDGNGNGGNGNGGNGNGGGGGEAEGASLPAGTFYHPHGVPHFGEGIPCVVNSPSLQFALDEAFGSGGGGVGGGWQYPVWGSGLGRSDLANSFWKVGG